MKLTEVLEAVRDEHLPLEKLESFRDQLVHLKTDIAIQLADKKKARAMFLVTAEGSVAARKLAFDATEEGQRLITLEGYMRGLGGEIDSLQGRIYAALRLQG